MAKTGGVAQVVELLSSKSSNSSAAKTNKQKKNASMSKHLQLCKRLL
jgi:hypothetical protein